MTVPRAGAVGVEEVVAAAEDGAAGAEAVTLTPSLTPPRISGPGRRLPPNSDGAEDEAGRSGEGPGSWSGPGSS